MLDINLSDEQLMDRYRLTFEDVIVLRSELIKRGWEQKIKDLELEAEYEIRHDVIDAFAALEDQPRIRSNSDDD